MSIKTAASRIGGLLWRPEAPVRRNVGLGQPRNEDRRQHQKEAGLPRGTLSFRAGGGFIKLPSAFAWFILLIFFLLFYPFRLKAVTRAGIEIPENTLVKVRIRITRQPYLKDSYQVIEAGRIWLKTGLFPAYFYGQKIEISGKFKKQVINRFRVRFISYFPSIRLVEEGKKVPSLTSFLLYLRARLEGGLESLLPEPHSSLLLGIIFGIKKQMPQKFWQNLRETGTLHIVVASGQNLTIIARILLGVLIWIMSRKKALVVAALGVIGYILMTGAEAPVIRAGIMALLGYWAQLIGREQQGTIALLFAAAIMLLVSPLILFDIGFQLSFAATAGIIWFYPLLVGSEQPVYSGRSALPANRQALPAGRQVGRRQAGQGVRRKLISKIPIFGESLATTIAAQLGVMPIILTNFGQMGFLSPLINGLILWLVPIIMFLGLILSLLVLFIKPIAFLLSWFVWCLLEIFIRVINFFAQLPWASFTIQPPSWVWMLGYYLVALIFLFLYHRANSAPDRKPIGAPGEGVDERT